MWVATSQDEAFAVRYLIVTRAGGDACAPSTESCLRVLILLKGGGFLVFVDEVVDGLGLKDRLDASLAARLSVLRAVCQEEESYQRQLVDCSGPFYKQALHLSWRRCEAFVLVGQSSALRKQSLKDA